MIRKVINDSFKEKNVKGIIIFYHVEEGEIMDVIDVCAEKDTQDSLYQCLHQCKDDFKITRDKIEDIKEDFKDKYLFSEEQYVKVLILEIRKK